MPPRPDDFGDGDEIIVQGLLERFTPRQLAEELVRRCGCAFDRRLPDGAQPIYECEFHRVPRQAFALLQTAAQAAMQALGPAAVCECMGCAAETNVAIKALQEGGIVYEMRGKKPTVHNVAAERRGNVIAAEPLSADELDDLVDLLERMVDGEPRNPDVMAWFPVLTKFRSMRETDGRVELSPQLRSVTRVEVIGDAGRLFTLLSLTRVGLSFQDANRTLKVFVEGDPLQGGR